MAKFKNLVGVKIGRLLVIERIGTQSGHPLWRCLCDCGNETTVITCDLMQRKTCSCGCLKKDFLKSNLEHQKKAGKARGAQLTTHGKSKARLYHIWKSMKQRCQNPHDRYFKNYGERGITVCENWQSFEKFYEWAMKNGYDDSAPFGLCTIDRIDVDKGYFPANCRWVDLKIQAKNRRRKNA